MEAQRQLAARDPWMAHLAVDLHRLALPAPADLPDADEIGREPAVDRHLIDLLMAAERVEVERLEPGGNVEISLRGAGRDVAARDLERPRGVRLSNDGVGALDSYRPDADTEGSDVDVPGQRKDVGAARGRSGHSHLEVEISGER